MAAPATSAVVFDMSMSLDGYIRAADPRPEQPLGEGGEALHVWAMNADDAAGRAVLEGGIAGTGAVICGRATIMGGPAVGNQFLRAGLVDELSVHVVPVLFGSGTRLIETLPAHIELELADHVATANAMHLRYRVVERS